MKNFRILYLLFAYCIAIISCQYKKKSKFDDVANIAHYYNFDPDTTFGNNNNSNLSIPVANHVFSISPVAYASPLRIPNAYAWRDKSVNLASFASKIGNQKAPFDKKSEFTTGFTVQKLISWNLSYFGWLKHPDTACVAEIYTHGYRSANASIGKVEYLRNYEKNILGLGEYLVYQYYVPGVCNVNSELIYILLPKKRGQYEADFDGFALSCDSLKWYPNKDHNQDALSLIFGHTEGDKMEVLMHYDPTLARFYPIAHNVIKEKREYPVY